MTWNPISSAPRDGTPIILYHPSGRLSACREAGTLTRERGAFMDGDAQRHSQTCGIRCLPCQN